MNEWYEFLRQNSLVIRTRVAKTNPVTDFHAVITLKGKRGLVYKESGDAKTYEKCIGTGNTINSCIDNLFRMISGNTLTFKTKDGDTFIQFPVLRGTI